MYIQIEFGENLSMVIKDFCSKCDDRYNLGTELHSAFGIDLESIVTSAFSIKAKSLKVLIETEKADDQA